MIKEFILISLAIEYCALTIYCSVCVALLMFGLTPSIAAVINRITLDWGRLLSRVKPATEVMRMGTLLANEDAV